MEFKIIEAESKNVEQVGKLFDLYRQFYKYDSNLIVSTNYIKYRINNNYIDEKLQLNAFCLKFIFMFIVYFPWWFL